MPHVIVKLWPGKSEQQKARPSEEIAKDVMNVLNYGEESVSVAMEEVKPEDWVEKVYKPDIQDGDIHTLQPTLADFGLVWDLNDCGCLTKVPLSSWREIR
jgi:4-oxalocrotonate tautomerase